jgi:hypothetical protein
MPDSPSAGLLRELLKSSNAQMRVHFEKNRKQLEHSGNKGSVAEEILRVFLREYMPRKFSIAHGEVIDRDAKRTGQIDVVVVNEHHPFTFTDSAPGMFFIEGVSAVGEVKSVLTLAELARTFESARKYKELTAIMPSGAVSVVTSNAHKRFSPHPPYFLFAFESQASIESLYRRVLELTEGVYSPGESIDGIFVLDAGYLVDLGSGRDGFQILDATTKQPFTGWRPQVSPDDVLFAFLAWLFIVQPIFVGGTPILAGYLLRPNQPA